jgi:hypothetical protein
MRLRRRFLIAGVGIACGLALAACGTPIFVTVSVDTTVHSALTGVFTSPTTRLVVTAQNLPGAASLADGSFSVVITTLRAPSDSSSTIKQPTEISVDHESTDLGDFLAVGDSLYFRVDVKDIAAFDGPGEYAAISSEVNAVAARPGLGYLQDILLGNWVGISMPTFLALEKQLAQESQSLGGSSLSKLGNLSSETQELEQLRAEVSSSLIESMRTWLSIHKTASDEYSLKLPLRPFVSSVVDKLAAPVEAILNEPNVPQAEITKGLDEIPAGLSAHANLWVSDGSLSKIQVFIPETSACLWIAVSHPAISLASPSDATMLTSSDLEALFADLAPSIRSGVAAASA